jgi:hypothetical protein
MVEDLVLVLEGNPLVARAEGVERCETLFLKEQ